MKEKSTVELKDQIAKLEERKKEIFATIEKEERKQTKEEQKELGDIAVKVAESEYEIKLLEARSKQKPIPVKRSCSSSSSLLLTTIRCAVNGTSNDEVEALMEKGREEMRSAGVGSTGGLVLPMEYRGNNVQATITGDGQEAVPSELLDIAGPLRDRLVLVQAGASYMTGLVGNIDMPSYSGSTVSWEGEVSTAKNGKGTFSKKTMSPKRITAYLDISKQFLIQDSVGAGNLLMSDLTNAVAQKVQSTIFGGHAHSATMPDGFFTGTPVYKMSGAASYQGIVGLESAVETDNALEGNLAYVINPKARGVLKTTLRAPNVAEGFILDSSGLLNGYKCLVTSGMATNLQTDGDEEGVVFGNWADYVIGQWGGLDITVDPYTKASDGMIRLVINAYFDAIKRRSESFAVGSLK